MGVVCLFVRLFVCLFVCLLVCLFVGWLVGWLVGCWLVVGVGVFFCCFFCCCCCCCFFFVVVAAVVVVVVVVVGCWFCGCGCCLLLADLIFLLLLHGQTHLKLHHISIIRTLSIFHYCAYHHSSRDMIANDSYSTIQPTLPSSLVKHQAFIEAWYPKHPLENGCSSWMTGKHYMSG